MKDLNFLKYKVEEIWSDLIAEISVKASTEVCRDVCKAFAEVLRQIEREELAE